MELFKSYPWPGNVRELRNVLERAAIACDRGIIGRQDLPADFGRAPATQSSELSSLRFTASPATNWARRLSLNWRNSPRRSKLFEVPAT